MDTLTMHRTLTEAGVASGHADAMVRVIEGGAVTKRDLDAGLAAIKYDLNAGLAAAKNDLNAGLAATKNDLNAGLAVVRNDLGAGLAAAKNDLGAGLTAAKNDLNLAVAKLEGRIDRLENKINLLFGVGLLAVLAPAITRLIVGQ